MSLLHQFVCPFWWNSQGRRVIMSCKVFERSFQHALCSNVYGQTKLNRVIFNNLSMKKDIIITLNYNVVWYKL